MEAPNTYGEGLYAPIFDERTDSALRVDGEIPRDLFGTFVQNSPNPHVPAAQPYHWFDGDGMVHALQFENGKATYRNRWVHTQKFREEADAGRALHKGILLPFTPGDPHPDANTANTDLVFHNGKLLALWWLGGQPYHLTLPELDTVGAETFAGTLSCGVAAHAKVDPRTGDLLFFDYNPYRQPYLRYGVVGRDGRVAHVTDIPIPRPSLLHDLAFTEHYTVLMDLPMAWDAERLATGKRRVTFDVERPSRWGVIPRFGKAEDIRWFEGPPCYVYHTVNAWEETGPDGQTRVVMIACRITNPVPGKGADDDPTVPRLTFLRLEPYLYKWTFDLGTGQMTEERLDDVRTEFPRANDGWLGRKSRYAYHPRVAHESTLLFDGFLKYDLERGTSVPWSWGPDRFGGETVFAPRHGSAREDDGWVVAFVTDRRDGSSKVEVLDGSDVAAGPVATVHLPRRVPVGFHAHWVPGQESA